MLDNLDIDHVVVVIDVPKDQVHTDVKIRKEFSPEKVSVLRLENYETPNCWSQMLDRGIFFLRDNFTIGRDDVLLTRSNEIQFPRETLDAMIKALTPNVSGVGLQLPGFTAESYVDVNRHTASVRNLRKVIEQGGFSVMWYEGRSLICDSIGGMEDFAFDLMMQLKEGSKPVVLKDLEVTVKIAPVTNQSEKEKTEIRAMENIRKFFGVLGKS